MDIGILGGTFDPIHCGHLVIAREVQNKLGLAEVLFIPAGQPLLKKNPAISAIGHRTEMVRLAISDEPGFQLSKVDIDRTGPSYTVETITRLKSQYKAADGIYFIVGWDSLSQLPHWKNPEQLFAMCRLVVVPRPGFDPPDITLLEEALPGLAQNILPLDINRIDVSSSEIRDRVSQGLSLDQLVPEPVERYIKEHGLYIN
ncbi:nicotinate-nucleotide adenylyltransferase [Chloroflexota bacterium]